MKDIILNEPVIYTCNGAAPNMGFPLDIPDAAHRYFVDKCNTYGNEMNNNSYLESERNAVDPAQDHRTGKYAEFSFAWFAKTYLGFSRQEPDCAIYGTKDKSFLPDLMIDGIPFNIKSCTNTTCRFLLAFGSSSHFSWTWNYSNNSGTGGKDRLFLGGCDDEICVFAHVNKFGMKYASIVATSPWKYISGMLKEPLKPGLGDIKKCLYFHDFQKIARVIRITKK